MKILVIGATGLLGSTMFRVLAEHPDLITMGSVRDDTSRSRFSPALRDRVVTAGDLTDIEQLRSLFRRVAPDAVINCIAAHRTEWSDPARMMSLFAILPQQLYGFCSDAGARLIQISSDGIFSGERGNYSEQDTPDATDLYGIAKQRGEVDRPDAVTLRTSMLGHSLDGQSGLLDWFLAQSGSCRGFSKAIFSGLPTVVIARLVQDILLLWPRLGGIFHIASQPISKLDLLRLVAQKYDKDIDIIADESVVLDRSLAAEKFRLATGLAPREWSGLVEEMLVDGRKHCTGSHVY